MERADKSRSLYLAKLQARGGVYWPSSVKRCAGARAPFKKAHGLTDVELEYLQAVATCRRRGHLEIIPRIQQAVGASVDEPERRVRSDQEALAQVAEFDHSPSLCDGEVRPELREVERDGHAVDVDLGPVVRRLEVKTPYNLDRRLIRENPRGEQDGQEDHEHETGEERVPQELRRLRRRTPFSFEGHLPLGGPPDLHGLTPRRSQAVRGRRGPLFSTDPSVSDRPPGRRRP